MTKKQVLFGGFTQSRPGRSYRRSWGANTRSIAVASRYGLVAGLYLAAIVESATGSPLIREREAGQRLQAFALTSLQ